jgi:WD40 repeat protein
VRIFILKRPIYFAAVFLITTVASAQDVTSEATPGALEVELIAETTVTTETQTAYDLAWHPDGDLLAVQGGAEVTIYDTDLQPVTPALDPTGANLAWSPDGAQLATVDGFRAREIRLWDWDSDARTLIEMEPLPTEEDQYAVTWSPTGDTLVTLNDDSGINNFVTLWDIIARELIWSVELAYTPALRVLDWNGEFIRGAGEKDGVLLLYEIDPETGNHSELYPLPEGTSLFSFLPDDSKLATITTTGEVTISTPDGEPVTFQSVAQPVNIDWHPDGTQLAILSYERALQIWSVRDAEN